MEELFMRKNSLWKRCGKKAVIGAVAMSMLLGLAGCGDKEETQHSAGGDANISYQQGITEATTEAYYYESGAAMESASQISDYAPTNDMAADSCYEEWIEEPVDYNTSEYDDLYENSWLSVKTAPLSTFGADVDTASYTNIRSYIVNGYEVPAGAVRIEEMINYFSYDYDEPKSGEKFAVYTEYADCPWNEDTKLALVSLNTEDIDFSEAPESNLVFLIDTSGSMFDENKLPLVQQSLCMLTENLTDKDRVSIVTYAGDDTVVLEGVKGDDYKTISAAIEGLEANGSTNGAAGIETAYELAEENFIKGGNNRVILCTDGDLNVGITSQSDLEELITDKKESGVFLSVIGVGYGNYKDNKLETLADKGNGNYSYIDSIYEAKRALVDEMGANMVTVAKDVKLQVEFNPENVKGYRLIGYENRTMAAEDFSDDTKDGGEMGAGHTVTAIYEIALTDSDFEINEPELKYDNDETPDDATAEIKTDAPEDGDLMICGGGLDSELFTVNVRYKEPEEDKSKLSSYVCTVDNYTKEGSDNLRWAAAVAGFGMYLKDSEYMGDTDKKLIINLAKSVDGWEDDDYKAEFIDLVKEYED
ncbi:MAG: VWA domain-containing protein [Lachnospiraceae bacterium]|nr:VWA domain-containing protein [Lachnospiraceae bacterium]